MRIADTLAFDHHHGGIPWVLNNEIDEAALRSVFAPPCVFHVANSPFPRLLAADEVFDGDLERKSRLIDCLQIVVAHGGVKVGSAIVFLGGAPR